MMQLTVHLTLSPEHLEPLLQHLLTYERGGDTIQVTIELDAGGHLSRFEASALLQRLGLSRGTEIVFEPSPPSPNC